MTYIEFIERALEVPFEDHGRSWSSWDCYGLLWVFYREVMGIILPSFNGQYRTAGNSSRDRADIMRLIDSRRTYWRQTESRNIGNVVLMYCIDRPVHIGVLVSKTQFLHAEKKIGTVVEPLSSPLWSRRIEGFYEYAA